jgi:hypothetical protein
MDNACDRSAGRAIIPHNVEIARRHCARYITGTVIPVDGGLRRYQF